jgi:hypothetical protein
MRRDDAYLLDILIATRKALKFVEGIDRNEFEDNEIIQNAVMRLWKLLVKLPPKFQRSSGRHIRKFHGGKWLVYAIALFMNIFESTLAWFGTRFIKTSQR